MQALHVPTLTIVALKMLPIYESDDLNFISSELGVLYKNLAELRLINSDLGPTTIDKSSEVEQSSCPGKDQDPSAQEKEKVGRVNERRLSGSQTFSSCPQLLAMYDGTFFTCNACYDII